MGGRGIVLVLVIGIVSGFVYFDHFTSSNRVLDKLVLRIILPIFGMEC